MCKPPARDVADVVTLSLPTADAEDGSGECARSAWHLPRGPPGARASEYVQHERELGGCGSGRGCALPASQPLPCDYRPQLPSDATDGDLGRPCSLPPPHLIDPHRLLEPLRDKLAAVAEQEAFAGAQPPHGVRHQYLPTLRLRGDSGREDHRGAEEVTVLLDRLAGVEADADG